MSSLSLQAHFNTSQVCQDSGLKMKLFQIHVYLVFRVLMRRTHPPCLRRQSTVVLTMLDRLFVSLLTAESCERNFVINAKANIYTANFNLPRYITRNNFLFSLASLLIANYHYRNIYTAIVLICDKFYALQVRKSKRKSLFKRCNL